MNVCMYIPYNYNPCNPPLFAKRITTGPAAHLWQCRHHRHVDAHSLEDGRLAAAKPVASTGQGDIYPRCSMYEIFTYIYPKNGSNVGKYSMHGAFGYVNGLVYRTKTTENHVFFKPSNIGLSCKFSFKPIHNQLIMVNCS